MTYSNTISAQGSLGTLASLSNLFFIFKNGILALITNWRLLSILNTIYKLIAKAIENRSKLYMSLWIRPQIDFVKKRHILENIFIPEEAIYWTTNSNQI